MPASIRSMLAIMLALTLILGGVGRFTLGCGDELLASRLQEDGSHSHHHNPDHDLAKKPVLTPACLKCCGICMADPALARAPTVLINLNASQVVFSIATKTYRDRPVVLDPGIPKPIA